MQFSDLYKCEENSHPALFSFAGFDNSLLFDRMVPTKAVFSASNFLDSGMLVKKLSVVIFLPRLNIVRLILMLQTRLTILNIEFHLSPYKGNRSKYILFGRQLLTKT